MTNKTKFNLSVIVFVLSLSFIYLFTFNKPAISPQTAQKAHTEELKTYEYVITKIDKTGVYGDSLKDDTGIYIDHKTVKNITLDVNDKIEVSFPHNDYETITKVIKLE
jgi:hypothetical protein